MATLVGILTFMSSLNFMFRNVEHEKNFITSSQEYTFSSFGGITPSGYLGLFMVVVRSNTQKQKELLNNKPNNFSFRPSEVSDPPGHLPSLRYAQQMLWLIHVFTRCKTQIVGHAIAHMTCGLSKDFKKTSELCHEKSYFFHMRKQRHRSQ